MSPLLAQRFPDLGSFAAAAGRHAITLDGMLLPTAGRTLDGTVELDWRLEDGTPLLVGLAEVVRTDAELTVLRFRELDATSVAALRRLGAVPPPTAPAPTAIRPVMTAAVTPPPASVLELVQTTYRPSRGVVEEPAEEVGEEVLLPPPGAVAAHIARTRVAPPRRGPLLVALVVALVGFFTQRYFNVLSTVIGEMGPDTNGSAVAGVLDVPPAGVVPSSLPPPAPTPEPAAAAPAPALPAPPLAGPTEPAANPLTTPVTTVPPPVAQPVVQPLDRLRAIKWETTAAGTLITLVGNGTAVAERFTNQRLDAPQPRVLLKLTGVDLPFREPTLTVGSSELVRIRTGFHPRPRANELHIVLDLPDPAVTVAQVTATGPTFQLLLARRP